MKNKLLHFALDLFSAQRYRIRLYSAFPRFLSAPQRELLFCQALWCEATDTYLALA